MSAIKELLGETLINKDNENVSVSSFWSGVPAASGENVVGDRVLGLYFSAHWCPPCRMFTPELATFYTQFKGTDKGPRLEIVFISSDQDEESFQEYLKEMPWPALPFTDRSRKSQLSKKFKVQGIPMLVIVDANTGKLITCNGRESVSDDPDGKEFPWLPTPLPEKLRGKYLKGESEAVTEDALKNKVKGLYFSAHWCPPCKEFTPKLVKVYEKLKADGKNFEIIFASSDRTEESFREYFHEMPWLAFPFEDPRISQLSRHFDVEGIPTLILLDENDVVINTKGRSSVSSDLDGANFPWHAPVIEMLTEENASTLNEAPCLILFTDESSAESALSLLLDVATEYNTARKSNLELPELSFFYEGADNKKVTSSVRQFAHLSATGTQLAIIDVADEKLYVDSHTAFTPEIIRQIVDDYKNEQLTFKPFEPNDEDSEQQ